MKTGKQESDHEHCYHAFHGPIHMVIPDGHIVQKCCKCGAMRTVHVDHAHDKSTLRYGGHYDSDHRLRRLMTW